MGKIKSRVQKRRSRPVQPRLLGEQQQQREEVRREPINTAGAATRGDPIPVPTNREYALGLPAQYRNGDIALPNGTHHNENGEIDMEEANRIIDRFRGGELQFLIDWHEEVQARFDEMMREIESRRRRDP